MGIFRDDSEAPRINMNGRQKLFILAIDFAIISELCIAISVASANMDTFTPSFMRIFFAMFLPTLLAGFYGHRKLRDNTQSAGS
ncbi:MAG: hypothetical protein KKA55_08475 [Proteobacteria bacterium]|nr:hypothetical protein [Pseudomonadota bacterium]MBU1595551.1 hypothetical protein [Pseudomonadota bacterium]